MGIKGLTRLLENNAPNCMTEKKFESYSGRKIAIDASINIYQFLIVVGRSGTQLLTNDAGEVTSHLQGMFARTIRLLQAGLEPVYVFDGKPPDLKKKELAKRCSKRVEALDDLAAAVEAGDIENIKKYSKRTIKVTRKHNDDCKKLLRLMGVPVVEASSEAEAECAALCISGKVYAVASEDMDSLTFGTPRFVRHLMDPSSRKVAVMEFEVAKILEELNLTMDQFIDLCILSGCDYCENIRGIGAKTALKLIRQHGSIEIVLENINKDKYRIPENWPYQEARSLFKEPLASMNDWQPEIELSAPDEQGLISFLVDENGFNYTRVKKAIERIKAAKRRSSQGRSAFISKPIESALVIKRRKETKCMLRAPCPPVNVKTFALQVYIPRSVKISNSGFRYRALEVVPPRISFEMDAVGRLNNAKPKYECLLFDMDDTLYPVSSGLNLACRRNIEEYMLHYLNINKNLVPKMCLELYKEYGTTMAGLKALGYEFDNDEFHAFVHGRLPYDELKPDPVLRNLLLSMPQRKIVFTNADKDHAAQVLDRLGLADCFEGIICFETLNPPLEPDNYEDLMEGRFPNEPFLDEPDYSTLFASSLPKSRILCKPSVEAIEAAIQIAMVDPKKMIFFDDSARNIESGKAAGLHTVIVGSTELVPGADLALGSIHNIKEALPEIWEVEEDQLEQVVQSSAVETIVLA